MWSDFHWLRAQWLWVLPLVPLLSFAWFKWVQPATPWQQLLAPHLQKRLLDQTLMQTSTRNLPVIISLLGCLLILAAAGPSWQKLPQPAFKLHKATVLVLDMSMSMRATDVKPNRLTQARFKALDFAKGYTEGELALISFAGDAFVISPLTPDHNNITLLLPDLKPEIMPEQGSNLSSAIALANQLLQQAGYPKGDIVVFSDGFAPADYKDLRDQLDQLPHRVSILAFGSAQGAPIQLESGELLKDQQGNIVLPKVPFSQMQALARQSGGIYDNSRFDNADIQALLNLPPLQLADTEQNQSALQGDQWQDAGIYLIWLSMPFVIWFGKKVPLAVLPFLWLLPLPAPAMDWQDLWKSPQTQAKQAYQQGDFERAKQKFEQPLWQGNAAYRQGDFKTAEQFYRQQNDANGRFNLGNSLAQQQQYQQALAAYQSAKQQDPNLPGLEDNIKLMQQLLAQQQNEQQKADGNSQDQQNQQGEQDQQQGEQQKQSSDGKPQDGDQQSDADANQDPNNSDAAHKDQQPGEQSEAASEPASAEQKNEEKTAEQAEQDAQQQAQPQAEEQHKAVREAWPNATAEQSQQLDGLMRKVQDDPALLLRNKMLLEYQKRQQQALPKGVLQQW